MTTTVIDQLIVTLGLDPKNFSKGQKEAAKALANTKDDAKKQSDAIGKAFDGVATKFTAMFLSFEGISKIASWLGGINQAAADLGRFSKTVGLSTHEVNQWGAAVELNGGKAEDIQGAFATLSQDLFKLKTEGEDSALTRLFLRMQVPLFDAQGGVRKLTDLYGDLGTALQHYSAADAANFARQAGISEGTLRFLLLEKGARDDLLAQAEKNNQLTEESTKAAQKLQNQWRELGQEATNVGQRILEDLNPALMGTAHGFISLFDAIDKSTKAKSFSEGFMDLLAYNTDEGKAKRAAEAKKETDAKDTRARGLRNNNPGNLRLPGGKHDAQGFSIFETPEQGIAEANKQISRYVSRGNNTIAGIVNTYAPASDKNDTKAYIADLVKKVGKKEDEQLSDADRIRLLEALFRHESGKGAPTAATIGAVLGPNPAALAAATGAGAATVAGGPTTNAKTVTNTTQIDSITVHTAATDADGVAAGIQQSIERKNLAAQADTGQT